MDPDAVAALGRASLVSFWIPLALWTVAAVLGIGVITAMRGLHPLPAYRVAQALLLALPVALFAGPAVRPLVPSTGLRTWEAPQPSSTVAPAPSAVEGGEAGTPGAADPLGLALGIGLLAAAAWGTGHLALLGRRLVDIRRLDRSLMPVCDGAALARLDDLALQLGVMRLVALKIGPPGSVPMTFGWVSPVIALPPELISARGDLEMALRHELTHVRRGDYAWGVLESTLTAAFGFHPVVRALAALVADARERSCDVEVAAGVERPDAYARLLVSMAGRGAAPLMVAAGFAPPASKLKERLETMSRFLNVPHTRGRARTSAWAAALVVLTVGFGAACAIGGPDVAINTDGGRHPDEPSAAELTSRFPAMSAETRDETLRRLDVQMVYLVERIEELLATVEEHRAQDEPIPDHVAQQYDLLNSLYRERLETYETLKLEAETERRLAEM